MIVEIARIDVKPDAVGAFVSAAAVGQTVFSAAEGCLSMELRRCVEEPTSFRMIVLWRTLEDHIVTFRNSEGVKAWRAAIGPHLAGPVEVLNFDTMVVHAGEPLRKA
jgi:quinol monooxygenase YgiN